MPDVLVDVNKLKNAAKAYESYKNELNSMLNSMKSAVNNLENEWKGATSKSFTLNHFPQMQDAMKKHIKKIDDLEKELNYAISQFSILDSELK